MQHKNDEKIERLKLRVNELEEELKRKDAKVTTLFSNLGHEIRTPLNGIMGFSEVLSSGGIEEEDMKMYLDVISESSNILLSIIKDALDISKIETDKYHIYPEKFDLNDLLYGIYAKYKDVAEEKGLQLFIENLISEEYFISSSPDALRTVLCKLIDNAIKFTKAGWIKIRYVLRDEYVRFEVEDTGIGIAEIIQSNLFSRFIDIDVSNSRKVSGTGLDLTLCGGLVKLLGGDIEYISKKDKGSVFQFEILNHLKE